MSNMINTVYGKDRTQKWLICVVDYDQLTQCVSVRRHKEMFVDASIDQFLNSLNVARYNARNVLVLVDGHISINYSRMESKTIESIQRITDFEFESFVSLVDFGSASTFSEHARCVWPPRGDGDRVGKKGRRG